MSAIPDEEVLFRRVRHLDPSGYHIENGVVRISTQAFSDTTFRPSVDQSSLCPNGAATTQGQPNHGVLRVLTRTVRCIRVVKNDAKGRPEREHDVDVHPDPIVNEPNVPDNHAHAEIRAAPAIENKNLFRKLLERLQQEATWEILPEDAR